MVISRDGGHRKSSQMDIRVDLHVHTEMGPELAVHLGAIKRKLELILNNTGAIMATKQEVAADIAEIKAGVAAVHGAANSAIALLKEVLARVDTAAANAEDLDAFRADFALIKAETAETEAGLKAAVVQNPDPDPAPPADPA